MEKKNKVTAILTPFDQVQKARRDLKKAYDALVEAHTLLQTNSKVAFEMADGDVRSICGLPNK